MYIPMNIPEGNSILIMMSHDESTFNLNDGCHQAWQSSEQTFLQPKLKERGIMISNVLYLYGRVTVPEQTTHEQIILARLDPIHREATEYFEYGKNNEGYWSGEHLVNHITKVVILIFQLSYCPESVQGLFLFENAAGHCCYANDALHPINVSMRPGGKQYLLCAGWYQINGVKQIQEMIFPHNYEKFPNLSQGLKSVVEEGKLWHPHLRLDCMSCYCQQSKQILIQRKSVIDGLYCQKEPNYCSMKKQCGECLLLCKHSKDKISTGCCALKIISKQPDFHEQKVQLQEEVEQLCYLVLFLLEFHCELNWIEYYCGWSKKYARENCGYSIEALCDILPIALDSVMPQLIGKYYYKTQRILQAYCDGIVYGSKDFKKV
ncbi:hypothetical protein L873DRAFT_1886996 [Choiromyces venosus 120613-1]|uniref:Uncharacterized protein n=1 Tax=Choiromyces venosus 120613-1 TaxID=1336337 RepID=A0A3N4IXL2_9PEZI|nr:hypothetical protein L873DRAFT_1886996 [Choiromyces venosus 120613-1]